MKKLASIIIVLLISFSMFSESSFSERAYVVSTDKNKEELVISEEDKNNPNIEYAEALKEINIFNGTNKGFELSRVPNRLEGMILLLRLLGEEQEAKKVDSSDCPFYDVPDWGKKTVAYAYKKGYTTGIRNLKFGSDYPLSTKDYATFLLRALQFEKNDYTWETANDDIVKKTIITAEDVFSSKAHYTRGDVAKWSYKALFSTMKNGDLLLNFLVDKQIISKEKADALLDSQLAVEMNKEREEKIETSLQIKKLVDAGMTEKEAELSFLINQYREKEGLKTLSISKSLTEVARIHVKDSNQNHPETQVDERGIEGNLHSWSKSNQWTGGAYTSDHKYANMMWSKPSELTDYNGNGYEIAVFSSVGMNPVLALDLWKNSPPHNAVITGEGSWNNLKTFGVGIDGDYAFVWFGKEDDPSGYYSK